MREYRKLLSALSFFAGVAMIVLVLYSVFMLGFVDWFGVALCAIAGAAALMFIGIGVWSVIDG